VLVHFLLVYNYAIATTLFFFAYGGTMLRRYSRIVAAVVLFFFTWTSGGLFSVAHAAQYAIKRGKAKEQQQVKGEGAEERLSSLTEELRETLADPKVDYDSKKLRLSKGKGELATLDAEIRKQFAETEKKLKDAKLPAEILERHYKFVKHYDDNLAELKGNIERVEKAKDKAQAEVELEKTRAHLERVKAPSRHQKLDPHNLPFRQPKVQKREPRMKKEEFERDLIKDKNAWRSQKRIHLASTGSVAGLLPQDDLAETIEVQFTPEIKAKAEELGNNPVKIYEWVRNNFEYESYYGSMKGAQQTLLERSGNDFDQATVLIALLRSANIPSRYVYGTVEMPIEKVMSLLGVQDPNTAANILASGGIPAKTAMSGGRIKSIMMEHVWVEAFVSMYPSFGAKNGPANAWTAIDPTMKEHNSYPSTDISKVVPFDESGYLLTQAKIPPSLSYLFALESYRSANYQGGIQDMLYLKGIKEKEFGILLGSLPFKIVTAGYKFSSIDPVYRHSLSIVIRDPATEESTSTSKDVCQLAGKQITVSYVAATEQDAAVMANHGGILKTPGYLAKVKARVKVDGLDILESPPVQMGDSLRLSIGFKTPGSFSNSIESELVLGIYHNIALSALNVASTQAIEGLDNSNNLLGTFYDSINAADDKVGNVLQNIGLQYFSHVNNASKLLERMMHIYNTRALNAGFVSVAAQYRELFGRTVSPPIISGLVMDIPRYLQSPFSVTGDVEQEKAFTKIQGLNTSYFEHAIWETFSGIDSVSTVKLLQLANEASVPIYDINSANINTVLPTLNQSQQVKDDIRNSVAAGQEVTIPATSITLNDWTGTGYMIRNPDTGEGAYKISSGLYGGAGTKSPSSSGLGLLARQYAALALGKPSNVLSSLSIGYWAESEVGDVFMNTYIYMLIAKGYIPKYSRTYSKSELLNLIDQKDNAIIFYSGHGAAPGPNGDALIPGYSDGKPEYVYPHDLRQANARIVFLNSCNSMHDRSFVGAFGGKNEVLLGWDKSVEYIASAWFVSEWWDNMFKGLTAWEAAEAVSGGKYTSATEFLEVPKIKITNPEFKL
jgi:hypothetical protein